MAGFGVKIGDVDAALDQAIMEVKPPRIGGENSVLHDFADNRGRRYLLRSGHTCPFTYCRVSHFGQPVLALAFRFTPNKREAEMDREAPQSQRQSTRESPRGL
jgi:hypothetical protein